MQNEERKESEITRTINDYETGVVLETLREGDKSKIIRKEQIEFLANHVGAKETKDFVMIDRKVSYKLSQENFTQNESKLFWFITSHLGYFDLTCHLIMRDGINTSDILTTSDILRLGGFNSKSSLERAIKGLLAKEIIKIEIIDNKRVYLANPFIFYRGNKTKKKIPKKYYDLFKDTKWFNY